MAAFLWIFQFISPIAFVLGGLYLLEDPSSLAITLGCVAAVVGLIIGIAGWAETVPPRWFWVKSSTELPDIQSRICFWRHRRGEILFRHHRRLRCNQRLK